MKTIFLEGKTKLHINLILSISFGLLLLLLRIKITDSIMYIFLIWNLFLAAIPYAITQLLKQYTWLHANNITSYIGFTAWLLFLPNSPYIITDIIHLSNDGSNIAWFDMILIFVFAFNGLILGLLSLTDMYWLIHFKYSKKVAQNTIFKACLLSGYGIFLGRFLRFNSWDIVTKPLNIIYQIRDTIYEPKVWFITFAFGGFLWILFLLLKSILELRKRNYTSLN